MLELGNKAPNFTLLDQDGNKVSLNQFKGKKVVLYFYPKDNTPGCIKQACGFGEIYTQIEEQGAIVLGVSKDTVRSHKRFQEKYNLPFLLLSDPELKVIQMYDVWKEKKLYGKTYMGIERVTYIINEEGYIEKIFSKVRVADNPKEVLEAIQ